MFRLGHEFDSGEITKKVLVAAKDLPLPRYSFIQYFQLPDTDRCRNVAHAVVEANGRMLVMCRRITCLGGQVAYSFDQRSIVGAQCSARLRS